MINEETFSLELKLCVEKIHKFSLQYNQYNNQTTIELANNKSSQYTNTIP